MFIVIAATWIIYNSLIILALSCQFHGFFMGAEFKVLYSRHRFNAYAYECPFTLTTTNPIRFHYQMHFTMSATFSAT
jgi:hypothetical protein